MYDLMNLDNLDLKDKSCIARDAPSWESTSAVAFVGRDFELADLTLLHAEAALVPALDDRANSSLKHELLLTGVTSRPELGVSLCMIQSRYL